MRKNAMKIMAGAIALTLGLTACGGKKDEGNTARSEAQTAKTTEAASAKEAAETTPQETREEAPADDADTVEIRSREYGYSISFTVPKDSSLTFENTQDYRLYEQLVVTSQSGSYTLYLEREVLSLDTYESNRDYALDDEATEIEAGMYKGYCDYSEGSNNNEAYLLLAETGDGDCITLHIKPDSWQVNLPEALADEDLITVLASANYDADIADRIVYDGQPDWSRVIVYPRVEGAYTPGDGLSVSKAEPEEDSDSVFAYVYYDEGSYVMVRLGISQMVVSADDVAEKSTTDVYEETTIAGYHAQVCPHPVYEGYKGYVEIDGLPYSVMYYRKDVGEEEMMRLLEWVVTNATFDTQRYQELRDRYANS